METYVATADGSVLGSEEAGGVLKRQRFFQAKSGALV
jgi:hypothetical protein